MSYARAPSHSSPSACCSGCATGASKCGENLGDTSAEVFHQAQAEQDAAQAKKAAEWSARPEAKILQIVFIGGLALWGFKVLSKSWKGV